MISSLTQPHIHRTTVLQSLSFGLSLLDALANPYTVTQARELLQDRIKNRITNFLSLCRLKIYSERNNPYRELLHSAGYTWDRLEDEVYLNGLEPTLSQMAEDGVYLDINEFKGKKPIIRKGLTIHLAASDLDMVTGPSVPLESSGSSGIKMKSPIGIDGFRLQASHLPLVIDAFQAQNLPVVLYYPMPSTPGIVHLISFTLAGAKPVAWFSQVPVMPWWRDDVGRKLATLISAAVLRGIHLPWPRFADIRYPASLAIWIKKHCPRGALVATFPGSALRLLSAANSEGIDLPPISFILGGEPITERKRTILEEDRHRVCPWFGTVETGRISLGCFSPEMADDMHLLNDRLAVADRPRIVDDTGIERRVLLFTSLLPSMHKFLLNVETGDTGVKESRSCGCPLDTLGLKLHLHSVRSFEKLTLEGMTYVIDSLLSLTEDILPAKCGGTSADYQFQEEEDIDGITRLVVLVNPAIDIDEDLLKDIVLDSLEKLVPIITPMAELLACADSIVVRREVPQMADSGKILAYQRCEKVRGK